MYTFEKSICEKIDAEVWKISTYPTIEPNSYLISSYGRIKNAITGRILKQYPLVRDEASENVYYIIKLKYIDHTQNCIRYKNFRVNRLVAWEFCEIPPGATVVEHINDNKLDNYYRNLRWSTPGENTRNAMKTHRLNITGTDNYTNKYDPLLIHFLCGLMEEGKTNKEILLILCGKNATIRTCQKQWSLINHLRAKDRFTEIAVQYDYDAIHSLSESDLNIIKEIENGKENIDIMRMYGYDSSTANTALYTQILKCRKIYKIRSTTRES